jgi:hypothetical protein
VVSKLIFCLQTANKRRMVKVYSLIPSSGIRAYNLSADHRQRKKEKMGMLSIAE